MTQPRDDDADRNIMAWKIQNYERAKENARRELLGGNQASGQPQPTHQRASYKVEILMSSGALKYREATNEH